MPSSPNWSIKIRQEKAYVVLADGNPLTKNGNVFLNIERAEVGEYKSKMVIK
ncbi:Hypothetical predicted protein, partial [Paramuricea clavata]